MDRACDGKIWNCESAHFRVSRSVSIQPERCQFLWRGWVYQKTFGWLFPTKVDFVVVLLFCGLFAIVYGSGYSTSSSFQTSWINRRQKTVKRLLKPTFVSSLLALGYLNAMASSGFSSNRPFCDYSLYNTCEMGVSTEGYTATEWKWNFQKALALCTTRRNATYKTEMTSSRART